MDRELPLIPTLIFIASLLAVIGLYMQVSQKLHRPPVSQWIDGGSNGLQILFKNSLISIEVESPDTVFSQYGISQHVGEIMLLDNGDRLLNTAGQRTSLLHKWRRYKRETEFRAKGVSSLLRCDSQFLECVRWGDDKLHFDTPWSGLSISSSRHLILDTARHQLYLVDGQGVLLDTLEKFRFPNHVTLHDDKIWVVDTNRNRLVPIRIKGDKLLEIDQPLTLFSFKGISDKHLFPSMAHNIDGVWFVLTHANGMNDGKVYRLENGKATPLFENQKDITTLYVNDGNLFIAAFSDHTLWSMDIASGEAKKVQSNSFENALSSADQEIKRHRIEFYVQAGFILAIGIMALFYSLSKSKPAAVPSRARGCRIVVPPAVEFSVLNELFDEIIWVSRNSKLFALRAKAGKSLALLGSAMFVITLIAAVSVLMIGADGAKYWTMIFLLLFLSVVFISIPWVSERISRPFLVSRLGSNGQAIFVKDSDSGDVQEVDIANAIYSNQDLYDGKVYVTWQDYRNAYYDKSEFESLISPLLVKATKVSLFRVYRTRLMSGEKSAYVGLASILMSIVALVIFKYFS